MPPPIEAQPFTIPEWPKEEEPLGITLLLNGETFLDGVSRIDDRLRGPGGAIVSQSSMSCLPGMRVSDNQIGIILRNGMIHFRPSGAYRPTFLNPWKKKGGVVPINREAGVEFDPVYAIGMHNRQSYRQIVLQDHQICVLEYQLGTVLVSSGTYVYSAEVENRGTIDLNAMCPVIVERETEDIKAVVEQNDQVLDQHGRLVNANRAHGTDVGCSKQYIVSGYYCRVAGYTVARPQKGFVILHRDKSNTISMSESLCAVCGTDDFLRANGWDGELRIEFGDMNHYAKSTPVLELKSRDNMDALCRVQIKWKQVRPDIWVASRGAFSDPFDMLEEKVANMMRDWLLSVGYLEALGEKAKGFTKVEHQWSAELNETGEMYGVEVISIEITTLRFPHIDKQDEQMAIQLAETNLAVELSRQSATKENEMSVLNQATHIRKQQDRGREAEAAELQEEVYRRINLAKADTVSKKAAEDTGVVKAEAVLELAKETKENNVKLERATAKAEADRVRAKGARDAAQLEAEGEIAVTIEKNNAQLMFLESQAALLRDNPGLVELLKLQNDLLKVQCLAVAAEKNPNVVLLGGQEGLEARRMLGGYAPIVPGNHTFIKGESN